MTAKIKPERSLSNKTISVSDVFYDTAKYWSYATAAGMTMAICCSSLKNTNSNEMFMIFVGALTAGIGFWSWKKEPELSLAGFATGGMAFMMLSHAPQNQPATPDPQIIMNTEFSRAIQRSILPGGFEFRLPENKGENKIAPARLSNEP